MKSRRSARRWRALVALAFLLPVMSANAVVCALCPHRHSHDGAAHEMMMSMGHDSYHHDGCRPELSDGACAGSQLLVVLAAPVVPPEVPSTNGWTPWVTRSIGEALESTILPRETPPPRA